MGQGNTLTVCALGTGINAGLFFAFSTFVMRALSRLPAAQGIEAMQSINLTIITPAFVTLFLGTALVCVRVAIFEATRLHAPGATLALVAAVLFLGGVVVVTIARNVPLNDALASVAPTSREGAELWSRYLTRWTAFNHVRTLSAIASSVCFSLSLRASAGAP